jgi:hypothetical protein
MEGREWSRKCRQKIEGERGKCTKTRACVCVYVKTWCGLSLSLSLSLSHTHTHTHTQAHTHALHAIATNAPQSRAPEGQNVSRRTQLHYPNHNLRQHRPQAPQRLQMPDLLFLLVPLLSLSPWPLPTVASSWNSRGAWLWTRAHILGMQSVRGCYPCVTVELRGEDLDSNTQIYM